MNICHTQHTLGGCWGMANLKPFGLFYSLKNIPALRFMSLTNLILLHMCFVQCVCVCVCVCVCMCVVLWHVLERLSLSHSKWPLGQLVTCALLCVCMTLCQQPSTCWFDMPQDGPVISSLALFLSPPLSGPDREVEAAAEFIQKEFMERNLNKGKIIYPHFTTATDTSNIRVSSAPSGCGLGHFHPPVHLGCNRFKFQLV